jgi:tetratricopeptide (TPR) repeat protein
MPVPAFSRGKTGIACLTIFLTVNLGCAHRSVEQYFSSVVSGLPSSTEIPSVPFYPQKGPYCASAAMAMVLQWTGENVSPNDLASELFTPLRQGSLQPALIASARRHNRLAYPIEGLEALLTELAAGHPVIVLQNLGLRWFPRWHYAVVIGYDTNKEVLILHSGHESARHMDWTLFIRTWRRAADWGLVVLLTGRLPASADEQSYVRAVLGLEHAGQWAGAAAAYMAALERWHSSLAALMGLGNCCCALGDLPCAEQAFKQAAKAHPWSGAAFNNLAHVLAEQGRYTEAIDMASRAVALGGAAKSLYVQTLREIQTHMKAGPD